MYIYSNNKMRYCILYMYVDYLYIVKICNFLIYRFFNNIFEGRLIIGVSCNIFCVLKLMR